MEEVEVPQFVGFRRPETEFYSTPNEWTDISADIDNLAELKIIEYIMRHTWGFKEKRNGKWVCDYDKSQKISTDEFMYGRKRKDGSRIDKGTKLSKQSVITGVDKAVEHGYIVVEVIKNGKYYKLKMLSPVKDLDTDETEGVKDLDKLPVQELDSTCQNVRQVQARSKETFERQLQKETLKESTPLRSASFTSEQNRIDEMHNHCVSVPPAVTDTLKKHWDTLAPHIQTQEQMTSLFAYTARKLIGKTDPEVKPGNLTRCLNGWQQEEKSKGIPWQPTGGQEPQPQPKEVYEPIQRKSEPLPVDMQMWIIDTAHEFGEDEISCVNELEWCFRHTSCSEETFYSKLIHAYEKASREKSMDILLATLKQDLLLVVEAMVM